MQHRVQSDLEGADFESEFVGFNVPGIGKMFCWGATVPADAAEGYGKGCLFIHNDSLATGAETNRLFANIGDKTSANFNALTIVSDS